VIIALWKGVPSLIMFYTDTVSVRKWRRESEGDRDPHPSTFDRAPSPQQGDAVVPAPVARHAFRRSPAGVHVRLELQNIAFSIPVFHEQQWSSHLCLRTPLRRSSILSPSASRLPDPVCSLLVSTATRGGGVPLASQCSLRSCRPSSTGRAERFNRRTRSGLGSAVLAPASRASSEGAASYGRRRPRRWTRRYPPVVEVARRGPRPHDGPLAAGRVDVKRLSPDRVNTHPNGIVAGRHWPQAHCKACPKSAIAR